MSTSAIDDAIRVMGGQSDLARALSAEMGRPIKQGHVWSWRYRSKRVPPEFAPYIETVTARAGEMIAREKLCPDFPWSIGADIPQKRVGA